jgi:hypothetical protein
MYIKIKGRFVPENVMSTVGSILDRAMVSYRHVAWDQTQRSVTFSAERYKVIEKRRFLDKVIPYKVDRGHCVKTIVKISNVVTCKLENRLNDPEVSRVTVLFGLKIDGTQIYLSSAEEVNGSPAFELTLNVSEVELEIADESKEL